MEKRRIRNVARRTMFVMRVSSRNGSSESQRRTIMQVVFEDSGEMFNPPFRFLPYCPKCGAELSQDESPCRKCGMNVEWYDPYEGTAP
jgi:hypothetical protein